jgi:ribonuclease P protein component
VPERAASAALVERLKLRADFLAAARGIKASASAFVLQARPRQDAGPARFGFTVARKVGNAVERNRVRRRLREMVRASAVAARRGYDYVVIGRRAALALPFPQLLAEFERALRHVHERRARRQPQSSDTKATRRPTAEDENPR